MKSAMKKLLFVILFIAVFTLTACVPYEVTCPTTEVLEQQVDVVFEVDMEELSEEHGKLLAKETKARILLEDYYEKFDELEKNIVDCENELENTCSEVYFNLVLSNAAAETFNNYMDKNEDVWLYNDKPEDIDLILEIIIKEE